VRASWSFRQTENYKVIDLDGSYVQNVTYRAMFIPARAIRRFVRT